MNTRFRDDPELLRLIEAVADCSATDEQVVQLDSAIAAQDHAARVYLNYMQFDIDLELEVDRRRSQNACEVLIESLLDTPSSTSASKPVSADGSEHLPHGSPTVSALNRDLPVDKEGRSSKAVRFNHPAFVAGLSVLAASLLIVAAIYFQPEAGTKSSVRVDGPALELNQEGLVHVVRQPQQVAVLVESTDAKWSSGQPFHVGHFFLEGESVRLEQGAAQISMVSGADIVLQAPCAIRFIDSLAVRLEEGEVTVEAAKWATGFVVETEKLRVTDLGTRFAVSVGSRGLAEAHVLEGSVLVEPHNLVKQKDAKLLVVSGEAIRVGMRTSGIDRMAAERGRFIDKLVSFHPYRQIEIHNTGRGIEIGEEDPHWRITEGHPSLGPWPQSAVVNEPNSRYSDNAPERSQWISVPGGTTKGVLNTARKKKYFTFETTFDISGFDPKTVSITAQFLADNGVQEIRLNGKPIDMEPWADQKIRQKFYHFREVVITDGFVDNVNRIEIDVVNIPVKRRGYLNAMALRVEWQAFGRPYLGL